MSDLIPNKLTLRTLRTIYGLTQESAGDKVGVSKNVWQNWEKGRSFPNIKEISKIEKEFNVSYNQIIFLNLNNGLTVKENENEQLNPNSRK